MKNFQKLYLVKLSNNASLLITHDTKLETLGNIMLMRPLFNKVSPAPKWCLEPPQKPQVALGSILIH